VIGTQRFELVIFDCDGVLVDSERLINQIESAHVGRLGIAMAPDEVRAAFKGHTVPEVAAILEARLGAPLPVEWLYDWGTQIALGYVRHLQPVPGVRDILIALRDRGVPICVASQSPLPRVGLALTVTDLATLCGAHVYTASMVPRGKPHPDLFLYAAARMGAEPGRTAVIEDSESGIVAARAAGMTVFGYAADEDPESLRRAGATPFKSMDEVPALIAAGVEPMPLPAPLTRLRAAYTSFATGDPGALVAIIADDASYHLPGRHLGGGTLRGRSQIVDRLADYARRCDDPPAIRLHGFAGAPDHLLSLERFTARRDGKTLDQDVAVVWRMEGDRCVEIWSRFADQTACDSFWG
jgi:HAD superfamily hydrolase (TIGR01509 family)